MGPIVAGEPVSDGGRMAYAFDFANLIGMGPHIGRMSLINPDVTAQVLRPPSGEWVAVTGDTRFHAALGRGVSSAALSDLDGVFAVASTSQLVQPPDRYPQGDAPPTCQACRGARGWTGPGERRGTPA